MSALYNTFCGILTEMTDYMYLSWTPRYHGHCTRRLNWWTISHVCIQISCIAQQDSLRWILRKNPVFVCVLGMETTVGDQPTLRKDTISENPYLEYPFVQNRSAFNTGVWFTVSLTLQSTISENVHPEYGLQSALHTLQYSMEYSSGECSYGKESKRILNARLELMLNDIEMSNTQSLHPLTKYVSIYAELKVQYMFK